MATRCGSNRKPAVGIVLRTTTLQRVEAEKSTLRTQLDEMERSALRYNRRLEKKVQDLELELRLLKAELRAAKRANSDGAMSAIKKLARDRAVGKKLVVAVHPDKVPEELNSAACEIFKILQNFREAAVPVTE